jgi:hypothetical protein
MSLDFVKATKAKVIEEIHDYTIDAFSDTPDFNWTFEEIKKEIKDGWELYGAKNGNEDIVAAVFLKVEDSKLLSKNTGLKIGHQGSGYSHEIKGFVESKAKEYKVKEIYHYCRIDNFRMYSLNESHGYKKTGQKLSDEQVVEWSKKVK